MIICCVLWYMRACIVHELSTHVVGRYPFEKWEDMCGANVFICCEFRSLLLLSLGNFRGKKSDQHDLPLACYYQAISGQIWNTICTSFHTNELSSTPITNAHTHTQIQAEFEQFQSFTNEKIKTDLLIQTRGDEGKYEFSKAANSQLISDEIKEQKMEKKLRERRR